MQYSISIVDRTNYDSENCRTGGAYSFSTHYYLVGEFKGISLYQVSYSTSSDFEYCSRCGRFHSECDNEFELVEWKEVQYEISCAEANAEAGEDWEVVKKPS